MTVVDPDFGRASWRQRGWLPVGAGLMLLVLLGIAGLLSREAGRNAVAAADALRVQRELSELLAAVQDAETGQRGYIITGDESYLGPYWQARMDMGGRQDELGRLLEEDAGGAAELARLVALIGDKLAELERTVALRQAGDEPGARALIVAGRGKALMQAIRAQVGAMQSAQEERYGRRERQGRRTSVLLTWAFIGCGLLGLGLAVIWMEGARRDAQAIRQSQTERDRLWKASRHLLAVATPEGRLRAVNPAWEQVLGWREDELLALPGAAALVEGGVPAGEHPLGDGDGAVERAMRARDGAVRRVAWSATREGDLVYASGRDVTLEREQAEALERAEAALRQAQKMEAIGQLTGGVAHDFNNMLAVVMGSVSLLQRRQEKGRLTEDVLRRHLDMVHEGARRAAVLTSRLLAFSRQQALQPEAVDLNRMVAGLTEMLRRTLGEEVRMETVQAGGLWRARVDPSQLETAVLNLAVNARDAMVGQPRALLTIETANTFLDEAYARLNPGVAPGQYVMVAVSDSGVGMPPEVAARAFDPFFTTKPTGKGTGLGLSMIHGFVRQSGGHVKIYTEPGRGTAVKIYLPRWTAPLPEEAAPDARAADTLPPGAGEIVLVVEDEERVRRSSVDSLRELGYVVVHAENGRAALDKLAMNPGVCLLFTDVVMPDMDGVRLASEAVRLRPDLRVLFTTGYTRNGVVHNGVLDPGVQLLHKPFTIDQLATKVRDVLGPPVVN